MRQILRRHERVSPAAATDPREGEGAQIISLATRNVLPVVAQRKPNSDALGLAAGVGVVALLGAVTFWGMSQSSQVKPAAAPPAARPAPAAPAPAPVEVPPAVPPQAITELPTPAPAPLAPAAAPLPAPGAMANPLSTPTLVFDASALPAPAPRAVAGPAVAMAAPAVPGGGPNEEFAARVGGVGGSATVATQGVNPQTTVVQGTLIAAVLETAIDTDVPGYVRAVVSADVRGFDGTRVMIPRSSRLIGQYRSGMTAGQKRAYVVWSRLIRPDGVSVNLASPATAFAGEAGLPGKVNTHFFERFGSAMLLSVVSGLSALGSGGATLVIGSQAQTAAAAAVGQTGQIGPTIRIRQGEPIRVFTARDLDFSKVTTE
jgi:type IV secretion system protein VirB10